MTIPTWRNIDIPSFAGVAAFNQNAQQNYDRGASIITDLLDQRAKVAEANWQNQKVNNTNEAYRLINEAQTPEDIVAKRAQVMDMLKNVGVQVDSNAVLGALDKRTPELQQRLKSQNEHEDYLTGRLEQPIIDTIKQKYAQGDYEGGDALLSTNPNLRNKAALTDFKLSAQTSNSNRALSDIKLKREIQGFKDEEILSKLSNSIHQNILNQEQQRTSGIQSLMKEFGVSSISGEPTNPDLSKLTDDQVKAFKTEYDKRGYGVGTSTTSARQQFIEQLTRAGVSATGIVKAGTIADTLFRKEVPLSAEDTANRDTALESLNAKVTKLKEGNIFYTDPAKYAEEKQNVFSLINSTIKDGPMTVTKIRDQASKWMDDGITIEGKDGKPVNVKVPPKVVAQAIAAGAETDTWVVNRTPEIALEHIKRIMTDPMHEESRKGAAYLAADGHNEDIRKIKRAYRNNSGTVNADDLSTNLDRALAKRLNK